MNIDSTCRIISAARMSLLASVVPCVVVAARIEVPPPAMPEHADTEVTTNIPVFHKHPMRTRLQW